ncbi:hypothetical protein KIW84_035480 [Lathyrus oleraceus]|uniref:Uncharacterized protein n=1 Tax=Pisum sativum TaxID=3888 RepID=A0A9D5B2F5_PEA|nr:hypothetical protein KIW84_035480 [Pisum sativum]
MSKFGDFILNNNLIDVPNSRSKYTSFNLDWNIVSTGEVAFVLKEKMKYLKEILRKWKKEVFGILNLEMEDVMRSLNDLDKVAASSDQEVMEDEELVKSRALASKKV